MAIDTANKRRNVMRIFTPVLLINLVSSDNLDEDDRENVAGAYIGYDYSAVVSAYASGNRTNLCIGIGIGCGIG